MSQNQNLHANLQLICINIRWALNWLVEESIPSFFDKKALLKYQLMNADEDPKLHGSFESATYRVVAKYGPNVLISLCNCHNVIIKIQIMLYVMILNNVCVY